jgi:hypothetical protein
LFPTSFVPLTSTLPTCSSPHAEERAGSLTLSLDEFKTKWERFIRTLIEDEFARVFEQWLEHRKNCAGISSSGYIEKAVKYIF